MATITPENWSSFWPPCPAKPPPGRPSSTTRTTSSCSAFPTIVPEQQIGNTIVPAVEPEWRDVRIASLALAERSKDLRVLVHLTTALLKTEGLTGLRDGLQLLKGTVEQYWDTVYPRLDPDDDNDPMERMNILRVFASRDVGGAVSVMVRASFGMPR